MSLCGIEAMCFETCSRNLLDAHRLNLKSLHMNPTMGYGLLQPIVEFVVLHHWQRRDNVI